MSLILKPVITEKSLKQATSGVYTFGVPMSSNKMMIAQAVKEQFSVNPTEVRIAITKGKIKRLKNVKGRRVDIKKAFVQLTAGERIAAFDMGQEPEAVEKKPAKKADKKTVAKATVKEAK